MACEHMQHRRIVISRFVHLPFSVDLEMKETSSFKSLNVFYGSNVRVGPIG
jgi:hypothetical protein